MNKSEFVKAISNNSGIRQADVEAVIKAMPEVIKDTVAKGEKVALAGFITFEKKIIPAKSGISRLGGVEKQWSTPEKSVVKVALSKTYADLSKE